MHLACLKICFYSLEKFCLQWIQLTLINSRKKRQVKTSATIVQYGRQNHAAVETCDFIVRF